MVAAGQLTHRLQHLMIQGTISVRGYDGTHSLYYSPRG